VSLTMQTSVGTNHSS